MNKSDVIELEYNQDLSVVQANELVRSKQDDLTLLEAKLIRLAIAQVLKDDTDLKTYSVSGVELARFLGVSKQYVYTELEALSRSIIRKCIFIKEVNPKNPKEPNFDLFHWVDTIKFRNGTITFRLSEELKPYLIGLDKLFTMYPYHAILTLPTSYSIRFYELMVSYERLGFREHTETYDNIPVEKNEVVFSIDALREFFNCADKYTNTNLFFKRVIDPSIEAVFKHASMFITYRTITKGKKITHIVFKRLSAVEAYQEKVRRSIEQ